jgi:hypothetical protein
LRLCDTAHIQVAGRARRKGSIIYYSENDPTLEGEKALKLEVAGKDASLGLTSLELQEAMERISMITHKKSVSLQLIGQDWARKCVYLQTALH